MTNVMFALTANKHLFMRRQLFHGASVAILAVANIAFIVYRHVFFLFPKTSKVSCVYETLFMI